ncbi:MAG: hypothetical protein JWN14_32 [Chthonomonadales bacterium]|nr:hypothetical protein [Chthonomonadales bacterium]
MTAVSLPPTGETVNKTPVSATQALAEMIAFAKTQHQPVPCIACNEDNRSLAFLAAEGEGDYDPCALCGGTRFMQIAVSPRLSLENIAALETLLSDLRKQGGRRS